MEKKFIFKTDFLKKGEILDISEEGLEKIKQNYDPNDPYKHVL